MPNPGILSLTENKEVKKSMQFFELWKVLVLKSCKNQNKLSKTLDYWSRDVLVFYFSEKRSATSFSTKRCVWFFKKNVSTLYSINWQNLIVRLSLLREILGNMCIVIVCFPDCNVKHFFYQGLPVGKNCFQPESASLMGLKTYFHVTVKNLI